MADSGISRVLNFVFLLTVISLVASILPHVAAISDNAFRNSVRHPEQLKPTIVIAFLVRNKEHSLPWFLHYVQNLDYPKERITIWIHTDHNKDNSGEIIKQWVDKMQETYHSINFTFGPGGDYEDQLQDCHWSDERFNNVIKLRQKALDFARQSWADYIFMLDADVILLNKNTLSTLIAQKKTVIAPLLNATASEFYANFWGGMDEHGYYLRVPEYKPILYGYWQGCFEVANIHTALLINLQHKDSMYLAYDPPPMGYSGPLDDIIIFAHSAQQNEVPLHILNTEFFGYIPVPMQNDNTLEQEQEQFLHIKTESIIYKEPLQKLAYIETPVPEKTTIGFDQIYMVNLARRPERKEKMDAVFDELGIKSQLIDAVDGKKLNQSYLDKLGVKMLDGYADPYHQRPLTKGEIGCFLSHWKIWQDVVENQYSQVLVFEDDLRFEPYFKTRLATILDEIDYKQLEWELIYLGRKRLNHLEESYIEDSDTLVYPKYSYWTLSYMLSLAGAKKLMAQQPLSRLIPVDEYLPVMFDQHPMEEWKEPFEPRDLKAFSIHPLLIFPTHYTGENDYITDTDHSEVIPADISDMDKNTKEESIDSVQSNTIPTNSQQAQSRLGDFGGKDEL